MAMVVYVLLLLSMAGWICSHEPPLLSPPARQAYAQHPEHAPAVVPGFAATVRSADGESMEAADFWRRTPEGWQLASWLAEEAEVPLGPPQVSRIEYPPVHPGIFGVALLAISIAVLLAFPCSFERRSKTYLATPPLEPSQHT